MRKGSHKAIPEAKPPTPPEMYNNIKIPTQGFEPKMFKSEQVRIDEMFSVMLRICDACHDLDGHAEPWGSIRRDIERLK